MPIILRGRSVVAEPIINEFCFCAIMSVCLQYPVVGTYRSLLWVVLHSERILRDIRNLINVSLFWLFFVYSLYIYRCFNLLLIYYLLKLKNYVLRLIAYELTSDLIRFILYFVRAKLPHLLHSPVLVGFR